MKRILACAGMFVLLLATVLAAQFYLDSLPEEKKVKNEDKGKVSKYMAPDTEYLSFYDLGAFETHLPVLHINTNGAQISKENKIWATLAVKDATADRSLHSVLDEPDYEEAVQINYRGASSFSQFDKKQYRIKFFKKEGGTKDKEVSFLGMGEHSEWVLNGPFLDKTLMRNKLVYELGQELFEWAPDSRYVEVFVNGKYQGVYLAVEPVTNGETRLRLCEFGLASGETAYVVKRDRVETEEDPLEVYGHYAGKTMNDIFIDYPTKSNLTQQQKEWIIKDIDDFERVLYSEYFDDPKQGYAKYIDVEAFADYVVLNEFVLNHDAGNLSTYIYKELGGKLKPAIWDYNNAFDNYQWFAMDYGQFYVAQNSWFDRLMQDRAFVDQVVARYRELRTGILSEEALYSSIDTYEAELSNATERNFKVWGYTFDEDLMSDSNALHYDATSHEDAIAQLKGAIRARGNFMDEHIEDLYANCVN